MNKHSGLILLLVVIVVVGVVALFVGSGFLGAAAHRNAEALFKQGAACEYQKDDECAIARYQKAIKLYGRESKYYLYLANVQARQGDYGDAITNLRIAKEVDPGNTSVLPAVTEMFRKSATQTAQSSPYSSVQMVNIPFESPSHPLPKAVFPIFDEDFGIVKGALTLSQAPQDQISYDIVDNEAYSGKRSIRLQWHKNIQEWASLVLGFDALDDPLKAQNGQMASINLSPPSQYALQFFARRGRPVELNSFMLYRTDSITLKFQDQNVLIQQSTGNQAVYYWKEVSNGGFIPDGQLPLPQTGWQEFCLPLDRFKTDWWIDQNEQYKNYSEAERQFDWSNVKQINFDANFFSTDGAVYLDDIQIIRATDCVPYPD